MSFIAVYITNPSETAARQIAERLLGEKLVACANIFPISSAYWWHGEIRHEGEYVVLAKSIPELWDALVEEVNRNHPYELPCLMRFDVTANEAYEHWIRKEVEQKERV